MRVAVTGSSGLIGTAVCARLSSAGHEVIRLVRRAPLSAGEMRWDPMAAGGGLPAGALERTDAVINLAGAPVDRGRWTAERKDELRASRVAGTTGLVAAMLAASTRPGVLLTGSAVGWYGDTGAREADELSGPGTGFLAGLARDWEAAAAPAEQAGIRVACLRTGIVLGRSGGLLGRLAPLFRLGLGARLGSGTQYVSWISLTDQVRAIEFLLGHDVSGPVNLTAPAPVTNAELTAALARALRRPAVLAVPSAVLRAALGEVSSEMLVSQRVLPRRLRESGFEFSYPDIDSALTAELARR